MCERIAFFLRGKHTPLFRQDSICGSDVCVVVNADNIRMTGKKVLKKVVRYHTGYVGHLREIPIKRFLLEKPEQLIFRCVSKMIPPNKLRDQHLKNLHVFRRAHNLTNYLPNFEEIPKPIPAYIQEHIMNNTYEGAKVIYESNKGGFDELSHLPRELDPEILIPPSQRPGKKISILAEDRHHVRRTIKYAKRLKKFKEYKLKRPRVFDPLNSKESIMINSEAQAKRWGYGKLVQDAENEQEEDEDIA